MVVLIMGDGGVDSGVSGSSGALFGGG